MITAKRPSPEQILAVVSQLSGIELDLIQSSTQVRKVGEARAAAAYLMRVDAGLRVKQVAPLLGGTGQKICDFSRNARLALEHGGVLAELIHQGPPGARTWRIDLPIHRLSLVIPACRTGVVNVLHDSSLTLAQAEYPQM